MKEFAHKNGVYTVKNEFKDGLKVETKIDEKKDLHPNR
jgi:hypothetical protein